MAFVFVPASHEIINGNSRILTGLSSQAGLRADGAGESALPAEESPSAGTGRARTLRILQENSIDFIMGAGEETSLYLPWS